MAFREGTFHEINNADWISNADLWWLFVVRLNKLLNKQSRVELLVIWDAMSLIYRQCNDRGPGIIVDMLVIFDTVLCGANTFGHGRHINCNGTRQYQPKGYYYMRHAKYLVSPSHHGVITSKRFPCCWPFVGRIHCWPVYFPHKGPWMRSFEVSFVDSLKIHENS